MKKRNLLLATLICAGLGACTIIQPAPCGGPYSPQGPCGQYGPYSPTYTPGGYNTQAELENLARARAAADAARQSRYNQEMTNQQRATAIYEEEYRRRLGGQ